MFAIGGDDWADAASICPGRGALHLLTVSAFSYAFDSISLTGRFLRFLLKKRRDECASRQACLPDGACIAPGRVVTAQGSMGADFRPGGWGITPLRRVRSWGLPKVEAPGSAP